jgi:S-adenosylmethionine:tRNA ribosyltransferase-isomerase
MNLTDPAQPSLPAPATPTGAAGERLSDYDYELPEALIAQHPPAVRGASRLLHVDGLGRLADRDFSELPALLRAGDLLVMNDTRVIRARLHGRKASGGRIELLVERIEGEHTAQAMIRASHPPAIGSRLEFEGAQATVLGREGAFFGLSFDVPVLALLDRLGELPLPPYIRHAAQADDEDRYQTVYARHPGAVAAPTAGLHFDEPMLGRLADLGVGTAFVTLHVGAGTFAPVREDDVSRHVMHSERYTVTPDTVSAIAATRARGGRVVAVGTTSLRALESAAAAGVLEAGSGDTALFIRPGYRFKVVDALITNFHLPQSTLLMLVSAFAGFDTIRAAYAHAVARRYRFFSYGDAMLLERSA